MPYAELFPEDTAAALLDRATNPVPPPPKLRSSWASIVDAPGAVLSGAARGVNESLRLLSRVATARARDDNESPDVAAMRAKGRADAAQLQQDADAVLRSGADHWRPDPLTATTATHFLHEAGRILSKVAGYSLLGGTPGAVVGTGLDEGGTTYLDLRDKGVDAGTAAQVGAVRGSLTALSVALPAAGATKLQSLGLVLGGGPLSYVAESALSREILALADYPHLAQTFDPFDPLGLALSTVPGAALALGIHAARARSTPGARVDAPPTDKTPPPAGEVVTPEAVQAAHVHLQRELIEQSSLGRLDDPAAAAAHVRNLDEMRAAMDEGRAPVLREMPLDEARLRAATDDLANRLRAADVPRLAEEARAEGADLTLTDGPAVPRDAQSQPARVEPAPTQATEAARLPMQRALEVAAERPELPVRMEDDGSPALPVRDLIRREAQAASREAAETMTATQAAITCFLNLGA